MQKYMKEKFPVYGLYAPERRQLQKEFMIEPDDRNEMYEVLKLCWNDDYREIQYFGIDYAVKFLKIFSGVNASEGEESLKLCYFLISTKSWWDTVDLLSSKVVGHLVKTYPNLQPTMDEWCEDENMWIRRASILYQLNYNKNTDSEILFRYCKTLANEKDFFIRKALGWALRNYGRFQGKIVKNFVTENQDILSNLTIKEALKNIK
ncbi:DgyrCDS8410 [Dimorphilus gyrociliatus]|nr:DgyrCDS8410 [Dimorphilus gyrociliatus]